MSSTESQMLPPLHGIRVIELARILAGPWAGQLLADLGADVIKVESPDGGDDTRKWGPPFVTSHDGENLSAAYYHSCNRGKRSIAVDFSKPEGAETIRKLVASADVLIENFKTGGLKKYGLDYASIAAINPSIVYCSITGFGQTGPYAKRPGYDYIVQGMGGLMRPFTGGPGGEPMKSAVAVADLFTGMYAVAAILAAGVMPNAPGKDNGSTPRCSTHKWRCWAKIGRQLSHVGREAGAACWQFHHAAIAPYEVLPTSNDHIILAIGNDGQFQKFCAVVGLEALSGDADFATNPARVDQPRGAARKDRRGSVRLGSRAAA